MRRAPDTGPDHEHHGVEPAHVSAWRQARRGLLCAGGDDANETAWGRVRDRPLLPKQREFVEHESSRFVMYSGSLAAGKTRGLCTKLVRRASVPGAYEVLCRKRLVDLKATTLKTLLEPDGDLPAVLPPGTYTHNQAKRVIDLAPSGGGQIYYTGMGEGEGGEQKLGSLNASGVAVDEWIELDEADTLMLDGQTRRRVFGLPNQIYGATNPSYPRHSLARMFGLHESGERGDPSARVIRTQLDDNSFLSPEYVAAQKRRTGVSLRRFVYGIWAAAEGLVYDAFDPHVHVRERDAIVRWNRVLIACDDGFTHPFVALLGLVDGDGRLHVADEVYRSELRMPQKVAAIGHLLDGARERVARHSTYSDMRAEAVRAFRIEVVPCDPSAALLIATLRDAGYPAVEADNDVDEGIARVRERLVVPGRSVGRSAGRGADRSVDRGGLARNGGGANGSVGTTASGAGSGAGGGSGGGSENGSSNGSSEFEHDFGFAPDCATDLAFDVASGSASDLLPADDSGIPRLTISSRCVNLLREMSTYEIAKSRSGALTERPVKEDDDAVDALRYMVSQVDRTSGSFRIYSIGGR